ncbi:Fructose-bisphosphate aldolase class II [Clostridiaceae bacterium JG1575]|nr:Fructose-bisphosphate aldolase class II [Clostridiaceae bacterium JG1575]
MALVSTKEMFQKAYEGGYAIGAFNINNMEIVQAVARAAKAQQSHVILQVSSSALTYMGPGYLKALVEAACEEAGVDMALHLDHGPDLKTVQLAIDSGFTSVMIDGSHEDFETNVRVTREVVEYAHARGVVVEAELGVLAGVEDEVSSATHTYTEPLQAKEFVQRTGCDSLAIAIGTSHGAFKFSGEPHLKFDILEEIGALLPGFPIVLHGASSVDPHYVAMANENGAAIQGARGIPLDLLRKAASLAVCKINMDTDLRLCMTGTIRKVFHDKPAEFDPRKYLGEARSNVQRLVEEKIQWVLGSEGSAKK